MDSAPFADERRGPCGRGRARGRAVHEHRPPRGPVRHLLHVALLDLPQVSVEFRLSVRMNEDKTQRLNRVRREAKVFFDEVHLDHVGQSWPHSTYLIKVHGGIQQNMPESFEPHN